VKRQRKERGKISVKKKLRRKGKKKKRGS